MEETNIFNAISQAYYGFTAAERKVADCIFSLQAEVQRMSISELAESSGVAEATVSRFCRTLRLDGFNALKLAIAAATAAVPNDILADLGRDITPQDSITEMSRKLLAEDTDAIMQTMRSLRPDVVSAAADLLTRADKVYCMGQGSSMVMAMEACHLFSTTWPNYFTIEGSHFQVMTASMVSHRDVLLFFSYSGSTKDILEVMQQARERQAKIILFTRFPNSPGGAFADIVFPCGSNEGPLQLLSTPARMAQLFAVDVLFHEVCRRDPMTAASNRERCAKALSPKHL